MALMKQRFEPVAWLQYLAVRAAFAVMQIFPIDWNLGTARMFARLWPRLMPRHRERAVKHLAAAFGEDVGSKRVERWADQCLESVAMFGVEAICLPRLINAFTWSRYITFRDFDVGLERMLSEKGVIVVTGHYGPFELPAHALAALGFDVTAVMRPLDNMFLNRFLVRTRKTHGLTLLDKKGAAAKAEQELRDGKVLAFVGDQDAGRKGIFVDFFGKPASTYKSIGLLAMAVECPIVVGYARRLNYFGRYEVGVQRVIHPHDWQTKDDPLRWITQEYTRAIEEFVREAPEQYLWIHRRWKSQPRVRRKAAATKVSHEVG